MFEIQLKAIAPQEFLNMAGLGENGPAKRFFCNELMKISNDYLPFQSGMLQASARVGPNGDEIIYNTPYARYLWFGKLMVDPVTGKGAFFKEGYGFWSRPNTQKVLTDRDLTFDGAPMRGSHWVERAYIDNQYALANATSEFIGRNFK